MRVYLQRVFDGFSIQRISIDRARFVIGRDKDCQLRPSSRLVSAKHCEIRLAPPHVILRDLGSATGTYLNGIRLHEPRELKTGDVLSVGLTLYVVLIKGGSAEDEREMNGLLRLLSDLRRGNLRLSPGSLNPS